VPIPTSQEPPSLGGFFRLCDLRIIAKPPDILIILIVFIYVKTFTKQIKNIFYRPPPVQKLKRKRLSPTPALFHAHCQKKWGGGCFFWCI
jgi:hypothetical protein